MRLLPDIELEQTSVVANCAMNRERRLVGYAKELGFDPVTVLRGSRAGWLDLCCGSGRALVEAAGQLPGVRIVGVDLVDTFAPGPVDFVCAPAGTWTPDAPFDLITCVHGLHYVGDKLGLLCRAATWLTPTGRLMADLDLTAIRRADGRPLGRPLATRLRAAGFEYNARRKRITLDGGREVRLPYRYVGADPAAGPNYTGQESVHSHYADPDP